MRKEGKGVNPPLFPKLLQSKGHLCYYKTAIQLNNKGKCILGKGGPISHTKLSFVFVNCIAASEMVHFCRYRFA